MITLILFVAGVVVFTWVLQREFRRLDSERVMRLLLARRNQLLVRLQMTADTQVYADAMRKAAAEVRQFERLFNERAKAISRALNPPQEEDQ